MLWGVFPGCGVFSQVNCGGTGRAARQGELRGWVRLREEVPLLPLQKAPTFLGLEGGRGSPGEPLPGR